MIRLQKGLLRGRDSGFPLPCRRVPGPWSIMVGHLQPRGLKWSYGDRVCVEKTLDMEPNL